MPLWKQGHLYYMEKPFTWKMRFAVISVCLDGTLSTLSKAVGSSLKWNELEAFHRGVMQHSLMTVVLLRVLHVRGATCIRIGARLATTVWFLILRDCLSSSLSSWPSFCWKKKSEWKCICIYIYIYRFHILFFFFFPFLKQVSYIVCLYIPQVFIKKKKKKIQGPELMFRYWLTNKKRMSCWHSEV